MSEKSQNPQSNIGAVIGSLSIKVELELKDAKKEIPKEDGLFVLMFVSNIDNRHITKCFLGYYDNEQWFYKNDLPAENVSFFAYLPEPKQDKDYGL